MSITKPCPDCGSPSKDRAFVDYDPNPNDLQEETDWGADLPWLKAVVCTECGYVLGVFNPDDIGRDAESRSDKFRVEEELR